MQDTDYLEKILELFFQNIGRQAKLAGRHHVKRSAKMLCHRLGCQSLSQQSVGVRNRR